MKHLLVPIIYIVLTNISFGMEFTVFSPDNNTEVVISSDLSIGITAHFQSRELIKLEDISIEIEGKDFSTGIDKIRKAETNSISRKIYPPIKEKHSVINDEFNELILRFRSDYIFILRVYNEGIAYRFQTFFRDSLIVIRENFSMQIGERDSLYFQKSATFNSSYETPYQFKAIKDITPEGYCCLPTLVRKPNGMNVLIMESNLVDYPGLWLKSDGKSLLRSAHAGYPAALKYEGRSYGHGQVKTHENYIARTYGSRSFPWRIFAISENDAGLISNSLVYQLARPSKIEEMSWIKPGVVTFDWWGRRNIYGTDFKSGINTETAKYFIDFAAEFGFEYYLFDDGWSKQGDLSSINPDLDMEEVMAYANEKDVKIMLWVIWNTFLKQEKMAWDQFEKWGISGIKFDFMMVIDFHGAYKPAGLRRMYPNVLTREALIEFEYNGWTEHDTPEHHNLLPYIRMVAGPGDYIPFTTHNATKKNFRTVGDMPMGMGTRAHSMALFVIMQSPMQMLPDSPSDYYREQECTEFISKIPVEWDDLKVLHAKIREHTVLARKNGDNWYLGAITDWNPKEFEIVFDFIDDGQYQMEFIEDGINADTRAIDYMKRTRIITKGESIQIKLAPGGGWVARLIKTNP